MFDPHLAWAEAGKLLIASVLGAAIGYERESHGQAAGIRTNLLVSVGACLMMLLSLHMEALFRHLDAGSTVRIDPGRIASYAIASMGFLGAGAILKGKGSVRGLTTAAGLWLVTAIGLSVGAGYFFPAMFTTAISLVILYGLRRLKPFYRRDIYTIVAMKFRDREPLGEIRKIVASYKNISVQFINVKRDIPSREVVYSLRLVNRDIRHWEEMVGRLSALDGLEHIDWVESDVP
jgi:putative Mg2+ transporter-C (MgtC) family protein